MQEKIVDYTKGDLKVIWKPQTCIHSEKCWRGLPEVFKPKEKPWIQLEDTEKERIIEQVKKCPSGALSYELMGENKSNEKGRVKVQLVENGPLMVEGELELTDLDGKKSQKSKAAFCRCGASSNKPFCDGSHKEVGFTG